MSANIRPLFEFKMAVSGRAYLAELIGTFALVFFGSVSVTTFAVVLGLSSPSAALVGIALTHGLVLMIMVYSIGHISGCHINPAVTIAMLATRRISKVDAFAYVVFQLLGATIAGVVHSSLLPQGAAVLFGATFPQPAIGRGEVSAAVIELILTFFLVFVIFQTAVSGHAPPGSAGIAIGMTLGASVLIGGPLTGAALNPARAFGPAVASSFFRSHWAYWVGPVAGALLAAALHQYVLAKEGS